MPADSRQKGADSDDELEYGYDAKTPVSNSRDQNVPQEKQKLTGDNTSKGADVQTLRRSNRILIVTVVAVSIVMAVFVGFYATGAMNNALSGGQESQGGASKEQVCTSEECIRKAGYIMNSVDSSVDPCDDFYLHACGNWRKKNYLTSSSREFKSVLSDLESLRSSRYARILKGDFDDHFEQDLFPNQPDMKPLFNGIKSYFEKCRRAITYDTVVRIGGQYLSSYYVSVAEAQLAAKNFVDTRLVPLKHNSTSLLYDIAVAMSEITTTILGPNRGFYYSNTWIIDPSVIFTYNPNAQAVMSLQSGLFFFYGADWDNANSRILLKERIINIFKTYVYTDMSNGDLSDLADQVAEVEYSLFRFLSSFKTGFVDAGLLNPLSLQQVHDRYPEIMGSVQNWAKYFTKLGVPQELFSDVSTPNENLKIYISDPEYYRKLNAYLKTVDRKILKDFAIFCAYNALGEQFQLNGFVLRHLENSRMPVGFSSVSPPVGFGFEHSDTVRFIQRHDKAKQYEEKKPVRGFSIKNGLPEFVKDFHKRTEGKSLHETLKIAQIDHINVKGSLDQRTVEAIDSYQTSKCVEDVREKFSFAVGRLFASSLFPGKQRDDYVQFLDEIKESFRIRLEDPEISSWLTEDSLKRAKTKLDMIHYFALVPDEAYESGFVGGFYDNFFTDSDTTYFTDLLTVSKAINTVSFRFVEHDYVNITMMITQDWAEVNAFYFPMFNRVVMPMGMLDPIVSSPSVIKSSDFGTLGYIMGHEFTHGFDNSGVNFNEYGQQERITDAETNDRYLDKAYCFAGFYDKFYFQGTKADGNQTLGENLADNGGFHLSWDAYHRLQTKDPVLPGVPYTQDQLFFINYATLWCSNGDPIRDNRAMVSFILFMFLLIY